MATPTASPFGTLPFASNSPRPSTQDINFVTQAAQSGLLEIQEGQLAQAQATDPAVKEFGRRMVTDHSTQNATLSSLARQEGIQVPTSLSSQQQSELFQLQSQNPSAFDALYLWGQIKDHTSTILQFIQEAQIGQDPVIKAFAQNSLPLLADHLRAAINLEQTHLSLPSGQPLLISSSAAMSMMAAPEPAMPQVLSDANFHPF